MTRGTNLRTNLLLALITLGAVAIAIGCGSGSATTTTVTVTAPAATASESTVTTETVAQTTPAANTKKGTVKLLGPPVLIPSSGRYYVAVVRLMNTSGEAKTVSVQFDGLRGKTVLDSETDTRTILPGEGAALTQLELPKGTRSIRASISVDDAFVLDKGIFSAKLIGKARYTRGPYGDCTMSVQIRNGGSKKLVLVGVWFIALRHGKIVSAGFTYPEVNPHLTGLAKAGLVPCAAKVDTVRAYLEA